MEKRFRLRGVADCGNLGPSNSYLKIANSKQMEIPKQPIHMLWFGIIQYFYIQTLSLLEMNQLLDLYPSLIFQASEDIEGISLDTSDILFDVKPTDFENMLNLRFLKIYCSNYDNLSGVRLPKGLESLPYELRLLHWENYPLQSLPQDFDSCHLVELNMSYSQLQKLWGGTKVSKLLSALLLAPFL